MSSTRSSSGVRNLRAMFEQNDELSTSHSPARSMSGLDGQSASGPDADRQVNKVRASFVSVQPDEPVELAPAKGRSNSGSESISTRRESFSIHEASNPGLLQEVKDTVGNEFQERRRSVIIDEVIPESAIEATPAPTPIVELPEQALAVESSEDEDAAPAPAPAPAAEDSPAVNPDKPVSTEQDEAAELLPADPKEATVISGDAAIPLPKDDAQGDSQDGPQDEPQGATQPPELVDPPVAPKEESAVLPKSEEASEPIPEVPVETTSEDDSAAQADTPSAENHENVDSEKPIPEEPVEVTQAPKSPETPRNKKASSPTSTPPSSKSQTSVSPPASQSISPLQAKKAIPEQTGIQTQSPGGAGASARTRRSSVSVKPQAHSPNHARTAKPAASKTAAKPSGAQPRPKSPTRPARLAAAASAPTAASAAKNGAATSPARSNNLSRKPSKVARETSTTARPAAHTSNGSRKPQASAAQEDAERPKSRVSNAGPKISREDFFARMMRPTASSASKVHEKIEAKTHAPARKPAPKPGTSATHGPKTRLSEGLRKVQGKLNGSAPVDGRNNKKPDPGHATSSEHLEEKGRASGEEVQQVTETETH